MTLSPLPLIMIEPPVRAALLEDLGRAGDLTTDAIVPAKAWAETALVARQPGVVAGLDAAALAFRLVDPAIEIAIDRPDGTHVGPGDCIATIAGPARSVLTAERVALNFLGHLSGVATATATLVAAVRGHKARICCTRKTMPGLRSLQKYAVRAGGGVNHRFGLDDAVLIKDNHVAAAGGVAPAIRAARAGTGHLAPGRFRIGVDFLLDELAISHNNDELIVKTPGCEEKIANANKPYEEEDRAFLNAVRSGDKQAVYCTYADAFETHRITMAINDSVASGQVVSL